MYAIVEIAGQQFKVEKNRFIFTHRLEGEVDAALVFDKVLLIDNDGSISVGAPTVAGSSVTGKIMAHLKGEKVIIFKKKRRKGYKVKRGHRQYLTKVMIEEISF
jgi:large subunit ribosomal protein L21